MPRPWRQRRVHISPEATHFKPQGIPLANLESITLHFDELEAVRLVDFAEMEQTAAAKKMAVPTTTFQRTLYSARKKIAEALIYGKAIEMKNRKEVIFMPGGDGTGPAGTGSCSGQGRGCRHGVFGRGPAGQCVCPSCNTKVSHQRGTPCAQQTCPKCGAKMLRASE